MSYPLNNVLQCLKKNRVKRKIRTHLDLLSIPRLCLVALHGDYHGVALSLQPMQQYIIATMFDDVLHCFCFVFVFCLVSLHGD